MKEESFKSSDGLKIAFHTSLPSGAPRAVVVINHGVNSHGGQYRWPAEQLAAAGFAVHAIDMRGRGLSEGRRFSIDDVVEYTGDLHQLIGIAKDRNPGLPLYLLGHSAGGVVSCTYALDCQDELSGLICESFAYRVPAPGPVLAIIKLLGRILPNLPVLKLKNEDFSRDPQVVAALNADPLIKGEIQPARTVAALLRATDRMTREFGNITLPVFIMHGTADKATMPIGSQFFHDTAGSSDKTLKLYDGHFHDLLNDVGKEQVMADIVAWISDRLPNQGQ
ncbi:lysophospholipase [Sphingomonas sp. NSE70-1]|uniref:Lysophospholipase n=1 Tax=Sphingomonas caseinilyticus TaxID=2908205 RepID=A0ABT0RUJ5_9SPHN|nr:alpha/beta hydrolase [Sphingomonas caseinilyticus]MCL6698697.1 lysophospholipase [Sphingomonas caseinilyticus]